ncbi:MAG: DUF3488 and transglutaminase-like domain-containing protein [Pseudoxanthomonas sp.]
MKLSFGLAAASPPLDAGSRLAALAAAALGLLPLLLQLPLRVALAVAAVGLVCALAAWRRSLPGLLRLALTLACVLAVLWGMGRGFGRDTGCALLAVMLAIKPAETASLRDGRSLLGFALFGPFAAFLLDQGPLSMALGLLAVLAALVAMLRLARLQAGLLVRGTGLRGGTLQVLRLAALGLPLVLLAFWLFPRLESPLWGVPERALGRPGLADSMNPGDWFDLLADDTPVLRARFAGSVPAPAQLYWRAIVMTRFDGRSWNALPWSRAGAPAVRFGTPNWSYRLDYEPTDSRLLVALDLPLAAPAGARLDRDGQLRSEQPLNALSRWQLQSAPAVDFDLQATPAELRQALQLPPGFDPRTLALGRQWRTEAGSDDAAIVRRALAWIRREFAYSLDVPLPAHDMADQFLFETKRGFCEQFSSSFAVLMRAAGIPARVVTGYAGGVRNAWGGYWLVRRQDAHAWTEVWLKERGWTRVDPTAAVAPERIYDTLADRAAAGGAAGAAAGWSGLGQFADYLRGRWNDLVLGFDARRQRELLRPLGVGRLEQSQLVALFALGGALALLLMAWRLARGERETDPLLCAWHRLGRRYRRLGLAPAADEPAQIWAARVQSARPQSRSSASLVLLSQRFAQARYAAGQADARALIRDLRRHRP